MPQKQITLIVRQPYHLTASRRWASLQSHSAVTIKCPDVRYLLCNCRRLCVNDAPGEPEWNGNRQQYHEPGWKSNYPRYTQWGGHNHGICKQDRLCRRSMDYFHGYTIIIRSINPTTVTRVPAYVMFTVTSAVLRSVNPQSTLQVWQSGTGITNQNGRSYYMLIQQAQELLQRLWPKNGYSPGSVGLSAVGQQSLGVSASRPISVTE